MNLTADELRAMVSIIDVAAKRGAFEGPELSVVGQVRNRLVQGLEPADKGDEVEDSGEV